MQKERNKSPGKSEYLLSACWKISCFVGQTHPGLRNFQILVLTFAKLQILFHVMRGFVVRACSARDLQAHEVHGTVVNLS